MTEEVTGIDLVEWMIRQAADEDFELDRAGGARRIDPSAALRRGSGKDFRPSAGLLTHARFGANARVETWVETARRSRRYYDPMLAKIITVGTDRADALSAMQAALDGHCHRRHRDQSRLSAAAGRGPDVRRGRHDHPRAATPSAMRRARIEVLAAGTQTTVQDYPGRLGYWNVGVPPSGPMDGLSFRLANARSAIPRARRRWKSRSPVRRCDSTSMQ